jgi:hypothetical protein
METDFTIRNTVLITTNADNMYSVFNMTRLANVILAKYRELAWQLGRSASHCVFGCVSFMHLRNALYVFGHVSFLHLRRRAVSPRRTKLLFVMKRLDCIGHLLGRREAPARVALPARTGPSSNNSPQE